VFIWVFMLAPAELSNTQGDGGRPGRDDFQEPPCGERRIPRDSWIGLRVNGSSTGILVDDAVAVVVDSGVLVHETVEVVVDVVPVVLVLEAIAIVILRGVLVDSAIIVVIAARKQIRREPAVNREKRVVHREGPPASGVESNVRDKPVAVLMERASDVARSKLNRSPLRVSKSTRCCRLQMVSTRGHLFRGVNGCYARRRLVWPSW